MSLGRRAADPERIEILSELPLNEVGKVDRHALQARALAEQGA